MSDPPKPPPKADSRLRIDTITLERIDGRSYVVVHFRGQLSLAGQDHLMALSRDEASEYAARLRELADRADSENDD